MGVACSDLPPAGAHHAAACFYCQSYSGVHVTFSKIITAPHPQCFMRSVLIVARLTGLCGVQLEVTRGPRMRVDLNLPLNSLASSSGLLHHWLLHGCIFLSARCRRFLLAAKESMRNWGGLRVASALLRPTILTASLSCRLLQLHEMHALRLRVLSLLCRGDSIPDPPACLLLFAASLRSAWSHLLGRTPR